ncbi:MAG: tetratricopeptide repeat protein [bacterium]
MRLPRHIRSIWKKFGGLFLGLIIVVGVGVWYHFWGPGQLEAVDLKAYNSVRAALAELQRDPNDSEAALQAGMGYYNLSNMNKAAAYYTKAIELDPASALAWNGLGNAYRELLQFREAEKAYQQAIKLDPKATTTYLNLANLYNQWPGDEKNQQPQIPKILKAGLAQVGDNPHLLQALVDYYVAIGSPKQADQYRRGLESLKTLRE